MKKLIALLPALYLFFSTCHKDNTDCPPDLPCATQTGENTFGCYINGKPWVAEIAPYIWDPTVHKLQAWYDEPNYAANHEQILQIQATRVDSLYFEWINIVLKPILNIGSINVYNLEKATFDIHLKHREGIKGGEYKLDTLSPISFHVTNLDEGRNIIAGIFSLTVINKEMADTLRIENGRFDTKYYPE